MYFFTKQWNYIKILWHEAYIKMVYVRILDLSSFLLNVLAVNYGFHEQAMCWCLSNSRNYRCQNLQVVSFYNWQYTFTSFMTLCTNTHGTSIRSTTTTTTSPPTLQHHRHHHYKHHQYLTPSAHFYTFITHFFAIHSTSTNPDHAILIPHTLAPHTLAPHTLAPHTLAPHTLAPHTLAPHTLAPHTLAPHSLWLLTLWLLTLSGLHSLIPHSLIPHPLLPHPLLPHPLLPHSLLPHSHSSSLQKAPHSHSSSLCGPCSTLSLLVPGPEYSATRSQAIVLMCANYRDARGSAKYRVCQTCNGTSSSLYTRGRK